MRKPFNEEYQVGVVPGCSIRVARLQSISIGKLEPDKMGDYPGSLAEKNNLITNLERDIQMMVARRVRITVGSKVQNDRRESSSSNR